jgi:hypothetical protein
MAMWRAAARHLVDRALGSRAAHVRLIPVPSFAPHFSSPVLPLCSLQFLPRINFLYGSLVYFSS